MTAPHRSSVRRHSARRAAAAAAVTVTAALVLTACGGGGDSAGHGGHDGSRDGGAEAAAPTTPAQGEKRQHNAADVAFAQGMIPHHRQAVTMSELAASRAASSAVKELAERIEKAQAPEIETMSGWLQKWGEKVPAADSPAGHGGHASGGAGHAMPGMMSAEDMATLEKASGQAFDEAFLRLMIEHHQGAVEMAGTELKEGAHQPALDLADAVVTTQTAEITAMRKLLGGH